MSHHRPLGDAHADPDAALFHWRRLLQRQPRAPHLEREIPIRLLGQAAWANGAQDHTRRLRVVAAAPDAPTAEGSLLARRPTLPRGFPFLRKGAGGKRYARPSRPRKPPPGAPALRWAPASLPPTPHRKRAEARRAAGVAALAALAIYTVREFPAPLFGRDEQVVRLAIMLEGTQTMLYTLEAPLDASLLDVRRCLDVQNRERGLLYQRSWHFRGVVPGKAERDIEEEYRAQVAQVEALNEKIQTLIDKAKMYQETPTDKGEDVDTLQRRLTRKAEEVQKMYNGLMDMKKVTEAWRTVRSQVKPFNYVPSGEMVAGLVPVPIHDIGRRNKFHLRNLAAATTSLAPWLNKQALQETPEQGPLDPGAQRPSTAQTTSTSSDRSLRPSSGPRRRLHAKGMRPLSAGTAASSVEGGKSTDTATPAWAVPVLHISIRDDEYAAHRMETDREELARFIDGDNNNDGLEGLLKRHKLTYIFTLINFPDEIMQRTLLHEAAGANASNTLGLFMRYGGDVSARDCRGQTPLHIAAQKGHIEAVDVLMSSADKITFSGLFSNMQDPAGQVSPVNQARSSSPFVASLLVKPATTAKGSGQPGPLTLEVSPPLGPESPQDDASSSPGSARSRPGLFKTLVTRHAFKKAGVSLVEAPPATPLVRDLHGRTPFDLAAQHDHHGIVECFLHHLGAVPEGVDIHDVALKDRLLRNCNPFHAVADTDVVALQTHYSHGLWAVGERDMMSGSTLLHWAVRYRSRYLCEKLLELGEDAVAMSHAGLTPVHEAVIRGEVMILDTLLKSMPAAEAAAILTARTQPRSGRFTTPLHLSITSQHDSCAEMTRRVLRVTGDDVRARDFEGCNAMHAACACGSAEALNEMIVWVRFVHSERQLCEMINEVNDDGDTPIGLAVRGGHAACVDALLQTGWVDLATTNSLSRTILHLAACVRAGVGRAAERAALVHPNTVDDSACGLVIRSTVPHLAQTPSGAVGARTTPLHVAVDNGDAYLTAALLADGHADIHAVDDSGRRPLDLLCMAGSVDLLQIVVANSRRPLGDVRVLASVLRAFGTSGAGAQQLYSFHHRQPDARLAIEGAPTDGGCSSADTAAGGASPPPRRQPRPPRDDSEPARRIRLAQCSPRVLGTRRRGVRRAWAARRLAAQNAYDARGARWVSSCAPAVQRMLSALDFICATQDADLAVDGADLFHAACDATRLELIHTLLERNCYFDAARSFPVYLRKYAARARRSHALADASTLFEGAAYQMYLRGARAVGSAESCEPVAALTAGCGLWVVISAALDDAGCRWDWCVPDAQGRTVLHHACLTAGGCPDVVYILLQQVPELGMRRDSFGISPVRYALGVLGVEDVLAVLTRCTEEVYDPDTPLPRDVDRRKAALRQRERRRRRGVDDIGARAMPVPHPWVHRAEGSMPRGIARAHSSTGPLAHTPPPAGGGSHDLPRRAATAERTRTVKVIPVLPVHAFEAAHDGTISPRRSPRDMLALPAALIKQRVAPCEFLTGLALACTETTADMYGAMQLLARPPEALVDISPVLRPVMSPGRGVADDSDLPGRTEVPESPDVDAAFLPCPTNAPPPPAEPSLPEPAHVVRHGTGALVHGYTAACGHLTLFACAEAPNREGVCAAVARALRLGVTGRHIMHYAVVHNDFALLQLAMRVDEGGSLLNAQAAEENPLRLPAGATPLWAAVGGGVRAQVLALLTHPGIDVHLPTQHGETPLGFALRLGAVHIALLLLRVGAAQNPYTSVAHPLEVVHYTHGPLRTPLASTVTGDTHVLTGRGRCVVGVSGMTPLLAYCRCVWDEEGVVTLGKLIQQGLMLEVPGAPVCMHPLGPFAEDSEFGSEWDYDDGCAVSPLELVMGGSPKPRSDALLSKITAALIEARGGVETFGLRRTNPLGRGLLATAALAGLCDYAAFLIGLGAPAWAANPPADGGGYPLHLLARRGHYAAVAACLASADAPTDANGVCMANAVDARGRTPLHCALLSRTPYSVRTERDGHVAGVVALLLERGAAVGVQDAKGVTPLMLMCRRRENVSLAEARGVVETSAREQPAAMAVRDSRQQTVLAFCVTRDVARVLVRKARLPLSERNVVSAAWASAREGREGVLLQLLKWVPSIADARTAEGETFLHFAAMHSMTRVATWLMDTRPELANATTHGDLHLELLDVSRGVSGRRPRGLRDTRGREGGRGVDAPPPTQKRAKKRAVPFGLRTELVAVSAVGVNAAEAHERRDIAQQESYLWTTLVRRPERYRWEAAALDGAGYREDDLGGAGDDADGPRLTRLAAEALAVEEATRRGKVTNHELFMRRVLADGGALYDAVFNEAQFYEDVPSPGVGTPTRAEPEADIETGTAAGDAQPSIDGGSGEEGAAAAPAAPVADEAEGAPAAAAAAPADSTAPHAESGDEGATPSPPSPPTPPPQWGGLTPLCYALMFRGMTPLEKGSVGRTLWRDEEARGHPAVKYVLDHLLPRYDTFKMENAQLPGAVYGRGVLVWLGRGIPRLNPTLEEQMHAHILRREDRDLAAVLKLGFDEERRIMLTGLPEYEYAIRLVANSRRSSGFELKSLQDKMEEVTRQLFTRSFGIIKHVALDIPFDLDDWDRTAVLTLRYAEEAQRHLAAGTALLGKLYECGVRPAALVGPDYRSSIKRGRTSVLHTIAARGLDAALGIILDSHRDEDDNGLSIQFMDKLNYRDEHGYAPLHYAVALGQHAITTLLLKSGADPQVMDVVAALTPADVMPSYLSYLALHAKTLKGMSKLLPFRPYFQPTSRTPASAGRYHSYRYPFTLDTFGPPDVELPVSELPQEAKRMEDEDVDVMCTFNADGQQSVLLMSEKLLRKRVEEQVELLRTKLLDTAQRVQVCYVANPSRVAREAFAARSAYGSAGGAAEEVDPSDTTLRLIEHLRALRIAVDIDSAEELENDLRKRALVVIANGIAGGLVRRLLLDAFSTYITSRGAYGHLCLLAIHVVEITFVAKSADVRVCLKGRCLGIQLHVGAHISFEDVLQCLDAEYCALEVCAVQRVADKLTDVRRVVDPMSPRSNASPLPWLTNLYAHIYSASWGLYVDMHNAAVMRGTISTKAVLAAKEYKATRRLRQRSFLGELEAAVHSEGPAPVDVFQAAGRFVDLGEASLSGSPILDVLESPAVAEALAPHLRGGARPQKTEVDLHVVFVEEREKHLLVVPSYFRQDPARLVAVLVCAVAPKPDADAEFDAPGMCEVVDTQFRIIPDEVLESMQRVQGGDKVAKWTEVVEFAGAVDMALQVRLPMGGLTATWGVPRTRSSDPPSRPPSAEKRRSGVHLKLAAAGEGPRLSVEISPRVALRDAGGMLSRSSLQSRETASPTPSRRQVSRKRSVMFAEDSIMLASPVSTTCTPGTPSRQGVARDIPVGLEDIGAMYDSVTDEPLQTPTSIVSPTAAVQPGAPAVVSPGAQRALVPKGGGGGGSPPTRSTAVVYGRKKTPLTPLPLTLRDVRDALRDYYFRVDRAEARGLTTAVSGQPTAQHGAFSLKNRVGRNTSIFCDTTPVFKGIFEVHADLRTLCRMRRVCRAWYHVCDGILRDVDYVIAVCSFAEEVDARAQSREGLPRVLSMNAADAPALSVRQCDALVLAHGLQRLCLRFKHLDHVANGEQASRFSSFKYSRKFSKKLSELTQVCASAAHVA